MYDYGEVLAVLIFGVLLLLGVIGLLWLVRLLPVRSADSGPKSLPAMRRPAGVESWRYCPVCGTKLSGRGLCRTCNNYPAGYKRSISEGMGAESTGAPAAVMCPYCDVVPPPGGSSVLPPPTATWQPSLGEGGSGDMVLLRAIHAIRAGHETLEAVKKVLPELELPTPVTSLDRPDRCVRQNECLYSNTAADSCAAAGPAWFEPNARCERFCRDDYGTPPTDKGAPDEA